MKLTEAYLAENFVITPSLPNKIQDSTPETTHGIKKRKYRNTFGQTNNTQYKQIYNTQSNLNSRVRQDGCQSRKGTQKHITKPRLNSKQNKESETVLNRQ